MDDQQQQPGSPAPIPKPLINNQEAPGTLTDNQGAPGPLTDNQGIPGPLTDDQRAQARGPLIQIFHNLYTKPVRKKSKSFILKVATSGRS